jgi:hypothetical protein
MNTSEISIGFEMVMRKRQKTQLTMLSSDFLHLLEADCSLKKKAQ